jgi:hypothetical protein
MPVFQNREQGDETGPIWVLVFVGGRKVEGGCMEWKYYVLMYENGELKHVETIARMKKDRDKGE